MARYHVIKPETGETQIVECSVHDIMDWYEANPGWERDWSHGGALITSEVGDWKSKLGNKIDSSNNCDLSSHTSDNL